MQIYLVILLIIVLAGVSAKYKGLYLTFCFGLLTIVSSLRSYRVGNDSDQFYFAYVPLATTQSDQHYHFRYEIGFNYLCKILGLFSQDPQILFIVTSIFMYFSIGIFIFKYSKNVFLSTILFMTFDFFAIYMNLMRQVIALSIILYGWNYLKNQKIIKYSAIVFFSSLFHSSAIIMLITIPFSYIKMKKSRFFLFIALFPVSFFGFKFLFEAIIVPFSGYGGYSENSDHGGSNFFATVFKMLITLVFVFWGMINSKSGAVFENHQCDDDKKTFHLVSYLLLLMALFQALAMNMTVVGRLGLYITPLFLIWVPLIFAKISSAFSRLTQYSVIILLTGSYWLLTNIYRPEWHGVVPFLFYWE
jgi:hypothetical protein